jgi:hypothetical protein
MDLAPLNVALGPVFEALFEGRPFNWLPFIPEKCPRLEYIDGWKARHGLKQSHR